MHKYSFENLEVWQEAKSLCVSIYRITRNFPEDEKFGLISQVRRAAISVSSNIAEGTSRKSGKDQANFYQIAYSSLTELLSQMIISCELGYMSKDLYSEIREEIEKISNKLNALRNSILKSAKQPTPKPAAGRQAPKRLND